MGAAGVDAHVVVKTAVRTKLPRQIPRLIVARLKHHGSGAIRKDRRSFFVVQVEILAHRVGADDEHVSI